jgi:hypothetical protein
MRKELHVFFVENGKLKGQFPDSFLVLLILHVSVGEPQWVINNVIDLFKA